jgi:hypothetical protein
MSRSYIEAISRSNHTKKRYSGTRKQVKRTDRFEKVFHIAFGRLTSHLYLLRMRCVEIDLCGAARWCCHGESELGRVI